MQKLGRWLNMGGYPSVNALNAIELYTCKQSQTVNSVLYTPPFF